MSPYISNCGDLTAAFSNRVCLACTDMTCYFLFGGIYPLYDTMLLGDMVTFSSMACMLLGCQSFHSQFWTTTVMDYEQSFVVALA